MQRRFPMIDFTGIEVGLFEPKFGALMARRSVQTLVDRFVRAGGEYRIGAALPVQESGARLRAVKLRSGEEFTAERFVFALGPWLPKIFPDVLGKKIFATRQEVFYFANAGRRPRLFTRRACPAGRTSTPATSSTAFPTSKIAASSSRTTSTASLVDPDTQDRRPTQAAHRRGRRIPRPPLSGPARRSADRRRGLPVREQLERRLPDRHASGLSNVLLVGGGSGHGFKHGPEVGRYAAARLFERARTSRASASPPKARRSTAKCTEFRACGRPRPARGEAAGP